MRGRKPKPTNLKILRGNPGKRKIKNAEPQPNAELPTMPEFLCLEAKEEWQRIAPELNRLGILTKIDAAALSAYCQAYGRWRILERMIDKEGMVSGGRLNQLVRGSNQILMIMHKFLTEFGCTPSSRSRLEIGPIQASDPFDEFLNRKRRSR